MTTSTPTSAPGSTWPATKRKLQQQWGIAATRQSDGPDWNRLATDATNRAQRVGVHLMDTVREAAREAGMTFAEAAALLQSEGDDASRKARDLGQRARRNIDSAKHSVEDLAAALRDGLSDGIEKSASRGDNSKSFAEGIGMAAGAFLNALTGNTKR